MLINCKVTLEKSEFVINTPGAFCPSIGMRIEKDSSVYKVTDIMYSEDTGMITLFVSLEKFGGTLEFQELWEYKKRGAKLEAIKFIKENRGWGLKESKDYIDEIWERI